MFKTAVRPLLIGATLLVPAIAGSVRAGDTADGEAVRAVWSAIDAAFNARDAEQFSVLFADDASFVRVRRKQVLEGRAAVYEEFARRFPNFPPDVRHSTVIHEIRAIAPHVIAADGVVQILRVKQDTQPGVLSTYAIFAVMHQDTDGWKVRALRIYELPPEPPETKAQRRTWRHTGEVDLRTSLSAGS